MVYFVTVEEDGKEIVRRKTFADYFAAVSFLSSYYRPTTARSVLEFATEVINGEFARSYVTLMLPEALDKSDSLFHTKYPIAAKQSNAFRYEHMYFFLIESEVGKNDADADGDSDE